MQPPPPVTVILKTKGSSVSIFLSDSHHKLFMLRTNYFISLNSIAKKLVLTENHLSKTERVEITA